jgi:hypothetical protein
MAYLKSPSTFVEGLGKTTKHLNLYIQPSGLELHPTYPEYEVGDFII